MRGNSLRREDKRERWRKRACEAKRVVMSDEERRSFLPPLSPCQVQERVCKGREVGVKDEGKRERERGSEAVSALPPPHQ